MKIKISFVLFCLLFSTKFVLAQNLTVKEIMRQPSIAGMRVSGERLSPNGKYVVYLWNAQGKNPRDLYLVSTSGGEAQKLLSPGDLITKKDEKKKIKFE